VPPAVSPTPAAAAAVTASPPAAAAEAAAAIKAEDDADVHSDEGAEVLCVVCWEGVREVGLLHGDLMHLCLCRGCAGAYGVGSECPMCRQTVEDVATLE
jgi:hypothetical protein